MGNVWKNEGTTFVKDDGKRDRREFQLYNGIDVMSYFKRCVKKSGVGSILSEGIVREARHELDPGTQGISPAYLARIRTPFIKGKFLSWDVKGYAFDKYGRTCHWVNSNHSLPKPISERIRSIMLSKPIEFTYRILLSDFEYRLLSVHGENVKEIEESNFFGSNVPTA